MAYRELQQPLEWPIEWPPKSRWKRFFLGVPWLGPDLSFFRDLRDRQNVRTVETMSEWGSRSERLFLAEFIGSAVQKWLDWPTPFFVPGDSFSVMTHGPRYRVMDDLGFEAVVREIEDLHGVRLPDPFWMDAFNHTFGEVIDKLLERGVNVPKNT